MNATMKVAPGRSLLSPKGMLKEGTLVREGEYGLTRKDIEHGVREGFLRPAEAVGGIEYDTPPPATKAKDMEEHEAVHMTEGGASTRVSGPAASVNSSTPSVTQRESVWDEDPKSLEGKDLDSLLVMILDKDPEMDTSTIDTVALAIEFLSQDFVPSNSKD